MAITERQSRALRARAQEIETEAKPMLLIDNPSREEILAMRGSCVELEETLRALEIELPAGVESLPASERLEKLLERMSAPVRRNYDGGNAEPWRGAPGAFRPGEGRRLSYESLFGDPRADQRHEFGHSFRTLGDFLRQATGGSDGTVEQRGLTGLTDGDGGFHLPPTFGRDALNAALESSIVMPNATVLPLTTGRDLWLPGFDNSDRSASLFGGFVGAWMAEGSESSIETPKSVSLHLKAKRLSLFAQATDEILEDASGLEDLLTTAMRESVAFELDLAFLRGTGSGEPMGLLNAPSLITVAKEVAQSPATILHENIVGMLARLHPGLYRRAVWLCHPSCLPELHTLALAIGTGGALTSALTMGPDGNYRLLSRPLIITEKCSEVGTVGDLILADLSQYLIALKRDISVARSNAPGFLSHQTTFRVSVRVDGQPRWRAAVTPRNGSSTLSWAVTLAERA